MNQIEKIEFTVVGSILFSPQDHAKVFSLIKSDHFGTSEAKFIYRALESLNSSNSPIDIITVCDRLQKDGNLTSAGGMAQVSNLTSYNVFSNLESHCLMILEDYLKREVLKVAFELQGKSSSVGVDVFDLINETETKLTNLVKGVLQSKIETVGVIKDKVIFEAEEVLRTGKKSGVPCSIERINSNTNGWQKSDLIILAGRPGMGKTSAAIDFVLSPALNGIPAAFFSLEMSKEQLTGRILSIISSVNVQKIINKTMNHDELAGIKSYSESLNDIPLFIDDTPAISISDLKNKARILKKEKKIEILVVDYLQLMTAKREKSGNREQEISEISRGLKALAKELDIPVIALSQLSRQCETRADKKPLLSDLRESGAIEQDADIVIFCHRPEYYGIDRYQIGNEEIDTQGLFMFLVAKFRNGSPGEIRARFIHENTMITNYR